VTGLKPFSRSPTWWGLLDNGLYWDFFGGDFRVNGVATLAKTLRVLLMGADFHGAMVATAPGEKLLTGRRLVRN